VELSVQEGILFKDRKIILPVVIYKEMQQKTCKGHLGVKACIKLGRSILLATDEFEDQR